MRNATDKHSHSDQHHTADESHDPMAGAAIEGGDPVATVDAVDRAPCPGRRQALAGAGVAALSVGALAGCAQAEEAGRAVTSQAGDAAKSAASGAVSSAVGEAQDAIGQATIPVGGGKVFPDLKAVVTQPEAGTFKAFSSTCTHQGCAVTSVEDGAIVCPCHNSRFDIATGEVQDGPATEPLPEKRVSLGPDGLTVT